MTYPCRAPALVLVGLVLFGSGPRASAAPDAPDAADAPPTEAARAAYWLDRLARGPEPTAFAIPRFHPDLLRDIERNLVALGPVTLTALSDPARIERLQGQDDVNPWLGILSVLGRLAKGAPDVARAWAVPAIRHAHLPLRRAAVAVFDTLASAADAPVLLEVLHANGGDRTIAPRVTTILLRLGGTIAAATARVLLERSTGDRSDGESGAWVELERVASGGGDGVSKDLLAWWALLTESSAPRGPDPSRTGLASGRSIDPARLHAIATPHVLTSGRLAAAAARIALESAGSPAAAVWVAADRTSKDPVLRRVAASRDDERRTPAPDPAAVRRRAEDVVRALRSAAPPPVDDVVELVRALRTDDAREISALLERIFRAVPPGADWRPVLFEAFGDLIRRGAATDRIVQDLLWSGVETDADLAFLLVRRYTGRLYLPILEMYLDTPAGASRRFATRRELAYLVEAGVRGRQLDPGTVAAFAPRLRAWIEDPEDPSASGLVAVLLTLGDAGEAELVRGLSGPRRALFVEGLTSGADGYVRPPVLEALLAPLGRATPVGERRELLTLVFRISSGAGATLLRRVADRVPPEARAEVETVLRIVRNRP